VVTTGATFAEAAAALKRAGSKAVDGISLVRVTSEWNPDVFWPESDPDQGKRTSGSLVDPPGQRS
jgi:hypothetical protein